jgi:hypothetical protein
MEWNKVQSNGKGRNTEIEVEIRNTDNTDNNLSEMERKETAFQVVWVTTHNYSTGSSLYRACQPSEQLNLRYGQPHPKCCTPTLWRMAPSGMWCRVALVRTVVSEEFSAYFIRVVKIVELKTTLAVTSNRRIVFLRSVRRLLVTANLPSSQILVILMMEALSSFETSVLTKSHTA